MIAIKDVEDYFKKDFNTILNDNDIVFIASDIDSAKKYFVDYEKKMHDNNITSDVLNGFEKWLNGASASELFDYDLDYFERYFKIVDNGNIYYFNDYL